MVAAREPGSAAAPASEELWRAFRRLGRALGRLEAGALAASGLPRARGQALLAIAAMGRPTMAMVAGELGLAPSTVTRLLDPLVRAGLLRRETAAADRRVVVVAVTPAGRQACRRAEAALGRAYGRLVAAAGAGSERRLLAAARELTRGLEEIGAPRPRGRRGA